MDDPVNVDRRTFVKGAGATVGTSVIAGRAVADSDSMAGANSRITGQVANENDHSATNKDQTARPLPVMTAHRGFAGIYPENTLAALNLASISGADMIEIDVLPCEDGTPVVFHDPKLSQRDMGGLTDKEGVVWETPCETVLQAEILGTGETIPTLEQALATIPPHIGVQIELKNPGSMAIRPNERLSEEVLADQIDLWRPFVERVLEIASRYSHEILVPSSREAAIAAVREIDPSVPIAFFFSDSIREGLAIIRRHDCEVIYPPIEMIKGTPFFDTSFPPIDLVEVAHEEGRLIYVFTLDSWRQADEVREAGVDGILSNYPKISEFSQINRLS